MSKIHPILFSTEMVKAILDGRKTQTRRIIKPQPVSNTDGSFDYWEAADNRHYIPSKEVLADNCPYGRVKNYLGAPVWYLWVRESFGYSSDGKLHFKADVCSPKYDKPAKGWKPSIHMPFAACRLFLKIISVKVEHLADITDEDAKAEGIEWSARQGYVNYINEDTPFKYPKHSFKSLWYKINGEPSWDANPWVWVIEFEQTEKPTLWATKNS